MQPHERISAKLSKFRPSLTLALKQLVGERLAQGLSVYDFGLGETKGELDAEIREAGESAFHLGQTMYSDPGGMPELRAAVLKWLNIENLYKPENVVITAGAKQSLFNSFLAICNPADCVLFDSAPWVSYQPLVIAAYGFPVQVLPVKNRDTTLKVTADDLVRNLELRPYTRMFVLNNPCNPTGQLYDADEVESLLQVCVKYKVYFVLDRLYWRIIFDDNKFPEPRYDEETLPWIIQVDGMSKNFRRTGGLRIGWSVAPLDVARAMENLQSHYTSGPSTVTQRAALAAVTRPYRGGLVKELQMKRDLLHKESAGMPHVNIWKTPASFYSFWDVRGCFGKTTPNGETLRNSDDVAAYLIRAGGVVTASGAAFLQDGYLRLSFATPEDQIIEGMRSAKKVLGELK